MSRKSKRQLGKGLSQLLGDEVQPSQSTSEGPNTSQNTVMKVSVGDLKAGIYQPRTIFNREKLDSLTESVKENGILQPILVRKEGERFEIVAGERRWRAAQAAGLTEVPIIISEFTDQQALESGIIENIQRDDLTPIEEAAAYKRLMDEFSYTQEQLSKRVGKSRSHIANMIRLLSLPNQVQDYISNGKISAGHARVLVGSDDAEQLADRIIQKGLNVRQLERYMKQIRDGVAPANTNINRMDDPDRISIERQLSQLLGFETRLRISPKGTGEVIISFENMGDVDSLMQVLMKMRGYAA